MSLQGEIITAFVAALGTSLITVCLIAHLLRDVKYELQQLRIDLKTGFGEALSEITGPRRESRAGHNPPPPQAA